MEVKIGLTKDILPGSMKGIEANGKRLLVVNLNGEFYAIGNTCTHSGCSLSDGTLDRDNVECPCHGSTFNIKTGVVVRGPAQWPERSYQVRVDADQILVNL